MTPLDRRIIAVAAPAIGGYFGMILFDVANIFWIGKLGVNAVAGASSASFIVWTLFGLMQTTIAGCNSLVAQFFGAGKRDEAHAVVREAIWLSLGISLVMTGVLLPVHGRLFEWMGLDADARGQAMSYFGLLVYGLPISFLYYLSGTIFNAYGDTRRATMTMTFALAVNMILDPVLMLGWGGFPALGLRGAAVALIISHTVGTIVRVVWLRRLNCICGVAEMLRPTWDHAARIVTIGVPVALTSGAWSLVYPLLTRLITPFGMAPVSAVGTCFRLESFPYYIGMGLSVAMAALVGQAVGSGDTDAVRKTVRRGLLLSTVMTLPFAALYVTIPERLVGLLTTDADTIAHGGRYLTAIGWFELFMGWELLFGGVFTGLGRTLPMMLITLPCMIGRIPLAWLLAYHFEWGAVGIWWAISLTTFGKGAGLAVLYWLLPEKTVTPTSFPNPHVVLVSDG